MWKTYRKGGLVQMRPWRPSDTHTVNDAQKAEGSPKTGDMICRDPDNTEDEWLITSDFFKRNYVLAE